MEDASRGVASGVSSTWESAADVEDVLLPEAAAGAPDEDRWPGMVVDSLRRRPVEIRRIRGSLEDRGRLKRGICGSSSSKEAFGYVESLPGDHMVP